MTKIILASASPRRQQLLREVYGDIEIRTKDVDESFAPSLQEAAIAEYLARKKSDAIREDYPLQPGDILITADTIVWLEDHVLNKPADEKEALHMLSKLSGRNHQVYTGVCIVCEVQSSKHVVSGVEPFKVQSFSVRSDVWFNKLSDKALLDYIHHYKPFDKAGSYGAQECLPENMNPLSAKEKEFVKKIGKPRLFEESLAVKDHARVPIISRIEGSYFNVMGLPLVEVYHKLRHCEEQGDEAI